MIKRRSYKKPVETEQKQEMENLRAHWPRVKIMRGHVMESQTEIDSIEASKVAERFLRDLLNEGEARKAIDLANQLVPGCDQEWNVAQLKAIAYVEGGEQLTDSKLLERGAQIFRDLSCQEASPNISYGLASAEHRLWKLAIQQNGFERGVGGQLRSPMDRQEAI